MTRRLLVLVLLASSALATGDVEWSYTGERGSEHWGELSPEFRSCSEGRSQSPVDIVDPVEAELEPLRLSYVGSTTSVLNNGHTLQVDVEPGSSLVLDGDRFELEQFHFHSPSEHRIGGEMFPMEAHFVHRNLRGELAVVGVLFRQHERHAAIGRLKSVAPTEVGKRAPIDASLADLAILPEARDYYRYSGSLTTPPCTEGVRWLVLKQIGSVSGEQIAGFAELIGEDARGPQPLNGRLVLE